MSRRRRAVLAHAVLGALLGLLLGVALGRALLLRAAKRELADLSRTLSFRADELEGELHQAFRIFDASAGPFCSDPELATLRAQTFRLRDLKDVGRTRDRMLYCSAVLGELGSPYREGQPAMTLADGTRVYTNVQVVMASAGGDRATVMESEGVDAVLSPDTFEHWQRSNIQYAIAIGNPQTGEYVPIAGASGVLTNSREPGETGIRQGFRTAAGVVYHTTCSGTTPICAITAESRADIWAASKAAQAAYAALGALAGLGLGLALAMAYLRSEGVGRQLRRALRKDSPSLRVAYEPIMEVETGRCVGAEALMRWSDRDGVEVSPEGFVRAAENEAFVGELTTWVLRQCTRELEPLLRQHPEFSVSINVAASDMNGEKLWKDLDLHVGKAGIDPRQINLELTERSTADFEQLRRAVLRLARMGYRVHIDDFGSGFSSLTYMEQLAVHAIKVDRAFTRTIGTDAVTSSVLPQILAMAETLQVAAIVEGVETEAQLLYLKANHKGVRAQGWYFSHPLSAAALYSFVENTGKRIAMPSLELTLR